jgi:hypothetical protein
LDFQIGVVFGSGCCGPDCNFPSKHYRERYDLFTLFKKQLNLYSFSVVGYLSIEHGVKNSLSNLCRAFSASCLFKVHKQESIQFGVSSKESKIAAMECSYLCTCVCIINQIAAMECSYLCAYACTYCQPNCSHGTLLLVCVHA